jgi:hypothetical protein
MKTTGRRAHRRRDVQLEVSITLRPPSKYTGTAGDGVTLIGRTRNLSEAGLALMVSAGNIDRYLKRKDLPFDIQLHLPGGVVKLQGTPIHYTRYSTTGGSGSYLIGSAFINPTAQQRDKLASFLKTLADSESAAD